MPDIILKDGTLAVNKEIACPYRLVEVDFEQTCEVRAPRVA